MINIGFNAGMLIGLLDLILSAFYLIVSIAFPVVRSRSINSLGVALYVIQAIVAPFLLSLAGVILVFNGWRLDPLLQLAFLLVNLLVIYLAFKDWLFFRRLQ
ncbi:hypothetical protein IFO70_17385 [Phormidium tenue FACHB-886]|nr:hypothetical protein [Phormidium tenue FACHB-886]